MRLHQISPNIYECRIENKGVAKIYFHLHGKISYDFGWPLNHDEVVRMVKLVDQLQFDRKMEPIYDLLCGIVPTKV